jgi:oligopeptide/dipeptide ABC transporter ATP-binding protein
MDPDEGRIVFNGSDVAAMSRRQLRGVRQEMQIVFQDPYASLNPRMTVAEIVGEPLLVHKRGSRSQRREKVFDLLREVGLSEEAASKYPHEFSGGQRQRVGIARALALQPKFIVADEPVSALDVSIRGEIINLMAQLQQRMGLTYLFISHDLKVVEHASHRVAVMYLGKLMELFPAAELDKARHPYTTALVSAIPVPDPKAEKQRIVLKGDVPSPIELPSGCVFHPRCRFAQERCRKEIPPFEEYRPGYKAACHYIEEM